MKNSLQTTTINLLQKNALSRKIFYSLGRARALALVNEFEKHLQKKEKIVDVGAGVCNIAEILKEKQYEVTPLDVHNVSIIKKIKPILYDGQKMPFKDNAFDTALLITVLHHIPYPEKVLTEAYRVAKKIVIIEDIYRSPLEKRLGFFIDSLSNLEFRGHPHSNKTDQEWQSLFKKMNLQLVDVRYKNFFLITSGAVYFLKKNEKQP